MCGRFTQSKSPREIAAAFRAMEPQIDWEPSYNIVPTTPVPVVRGNPRSGHEIALMRWGLVPAWARSDKHLPLMHNARAETVSKLPSYRTAFRFRRCMVPATGYYEWQAGKPKQPFYFQRHDGEPLAFAALWELHATAGESVSIITTSANSLTAHVHHRMPVILPACDWERWLEASPLEDDESKRLLAPAPDSLLNYWPVGPAVGNVRNHSPDLILPSTPPQPTLF